MMTKRTDAVSQVRAWYAGEQKKNLRDIKFFVGNVSESTTESLCNEMLGLFEAPNIGNSDPMDSYVEYFPQKTSKEVEERFTEITKKLN